VAVVPALLEDIAKLKRNQLRGENGDCELEQTKAATCHFSGGWWEGTSRGVISLFETNARIDNELTGVNLICEIILIVLEDMLIITSALYSIPIFIGTVL
jgi:hypothetical protein